MNKLFRAVAKAPNYVKRFGLVDGLRLLTCVERDFPGKSSKVRTYRVPGYNAPIALRDQISDHAIFWQCIVQRQYDVSFFPQRERLHAAYREVVEHGRRPLIIDCGGNIGLASIWLAEQFPEAVIYAVEPDTDNCQMLRRNTAIFGDRVVVLHGAVWPESGTVHIVNPESGSAAFRVSADTKAGSDVRAYTIDEICALAGEREAFLVKIDIEGAQAKLFSANTDWVGRARMIALELDDWMLPWQGTSRPFFSCLSRYPFDYLIKGETIFCFRDFSSMAATDRCTRDEVAEISTAC